MLGPSGSGKTTVLRLIAGFETPTEGRIELAGQDVTGLAPFERDVHTVFQDYALFPHMTRRAERRLRPQGPGGAQGGAGGAGARGARRGASGGVRQAAPGPAVRRAAPAGRARPGPGRPSPGAAARRAARGARSEAAGGDAGRAQGAAARGRHHLRARHPRPAGGPDDERPYRRLPPGPHRTGRHTRPRSTNAPRRPSSAAFVGTSNLLDGDTARADRRHGRHLQRPAREDPHPEGVRAERRAGTTPLRPAPSPRWSTWATPPASWSTSTRAAASPPFSRTWRRRPRTWPPTGVPGCDCNGTGGMPSRCPPLTDPFSRWSTSCASPSRRCGRHRSCSSPPPVAPPTSGSGGSASGLNPPDLKAPHEARQDRGAGQSDRLGRLCRGRLQRPEGRLGHRLREADRLSGQRQDRRHLRRDGQADEDRSVRRRLRLRRRLPAPHSLRRRGARQHRPRPQLPGRLQRVEGQRLELRRRA